MEMCVCPIIHMHGTLAANICMYICIHICIYTCNKIYASTHPWKCVCLIIHMHGTLAANMQWTTCVSLVWDGTPCFFLGGEGVIKNKSLSLIFSWHTYIHTYIHIVWCSPWNPVHKDGANVYIRISGHTHIHVNTHYAFLHTSTYIYGALLRCQP
jgi:hypothetical protein